MNIVKWLSIPVLLIASLFTCCAGTYEALVDFAICVGAIMLIRQAMRSREYSWASGLVAIVVVFTPLGLVVKIFLLMGLASVAVFQNLLAAFHAQQPRLSEAGLW